jgi:hypothetical protein
MVLPCIPDEGVMEDTAGAWAKRQEGITTRKRKMNLNAVGTL